MRPFHNQQKVIRNDASNKLSLFPQRLANQYLNDYIQIYYSVNKYLLRGYYKPVSVLGSADTAMNKTKTLSPGN